MDKAIVNQAVCNQVVPNYIGISYAILSQDILQKKGLTGFTSNVMFNIIRTVSKVLPTKFRVTEIE